MNTDNDENNSKQFNDKMEEEILPRRALLRGALALGCSMLLPAALFGCDSKKDANSTSTAPGSPPTSANTSDSTLPSSPANSANVAATTPKKVTQASVQYQTAPKGEQKCGICMHFIAESNSCKLVDGQINPEGWCKLWAKKA